MAAPTVYENLNEDANIQGQLFAGKKFWIAQRVFSRLRYVNLVKNNGGEVVPVERNADYLIADHLRRDCPPGSISYTFIDRSIQRGELEDPENHLAGPPAGTARESGSLSRPIKSTRAAFTNEEDRILYKWVRDQKNAGGLANGNEIYKALERKYPRHTWQSWRDRYVKKLQHMPPSTFNVPDNAPPSPPSDVPAELAATPAQKQTKKPTAHKPVPSSTKARISNQVNSVDYTVDELTAQGLFDKENWEQLYAHAEDISAASGELYRQGWEEWAQDTKQTAGQWRQYFEKVVLPQWQQDSDEKHARIKSRVAERVEKGKGKASEVETSEGEEPAKQNEPEVEPEVVTEAVPSAPAKVSNKRKRTDSEDNRFDSYLNDRYKGKAPSAYMLFAREKKWHVWNEEQPGLDYTGLHTLLMSRWDALSSEEKEPYLAQEAAAQPTHETVTLSSQVFLSSSTVVNETPTYITEAYEKALKQIRDIVEPTVNEEDEPRPRKTRKSSSPELGTKEDPLEISSIGTDSQELARENLPKLAPEYDHSDMEGLDFVIAHFEQNVSDRESASPTPRAPRYKAPAFDTQAILSSPSQGAFLSTLPLPADLTRLADTDTPSEQNDAEKLTSDASQHTTESLEEFSQIINEEEPPDSTALEPLTNPVESSPPPSPSSTGSGDPDPPLAPDEVDDFFSEQRALGLSDEDIAAALKHTRWRPELAAEVLEAWENGKPLPRKRGIWHAEDDEDVESGNGAALAELESIHTVDGWGGITERLNFLARYRDAKGM